MAFRYEGRELFHGNQMLLLGKLKSIDTVDASKTVYGTGLISVSAMENQTEVTNYAADDVPDHATISGASLLQGTMKFRQLTPGMREIIGQKKSTNGYGFASVGDYPSFIAQYVTLGTKQTEGGTIPVAMVNVYPNMRLSGDPQFESETDSSDAPTPVDWEMSVQATASPLYSYSGNVKIPHVTYKFEGDDVEKVIADIEKGTFITDTYAPAGAKP